jgi:hypothetical protein
MKKLYIVTLIVLCAASIQAAQLIYQFPDAGKMADTDRVYVYQSTGGNRNLTGSQFKYEALGGDDALSKQAQSSYSSVNPNTPNSVHRRVMEVKDRTGKIMQYVTAIGRMVIGTPKALDIIGAAPASGTTGLFNNYSVRRCAFTTCSTMTGVYWNGKKMTTPVNVQYNKGVIVNTSQQYINGVSLGFDSGYTTGTKVQFLPFSSAAGTTYTVRALRQSILQTDGEWTSSCGAYMTDNAGDCELTFSTR